MNAAQSDLHRYRPEIDGLRAIAVIAVVLFHADYGLSGGFVGVDVFFVISGFLVTGIISRSLDQGRFSIASFYVRRIRRIFPAAAVVTAAILCMAYRSTFPSDTVQISKAAIAQSGMVSNLFFWMESGYFSRDVLTKPFLHFWSLAVEEQFYLMFPAVLVFCNRWGGGRRRVIGVVIAIAIGSFALSTYGTMRSPSATFYFLPTRAWELMAGAIVALTDWRFQRRRSAELAACTGTMMIVLSFFVLSDSSIFPGGWALLPVIGTVLVIAANERQRTVIGKWLSQPALVFVGWISYSLYLWHWPVLAFTRYLILEPSPPTILMAVIASFLLATASWYWIEQPIRQRRYLDSDRSLIQAGAVVWCLLLIAPLVIVVNAGIPNRFSDTDQRLMDDATWTGNWASREIEQIHRDDVPQLGSDGSATTEGGFLLWGDSHAMTWTEVADRAALRSGRHGYATLHGGTPPIPGLWRTGMPNCREFNQAVLDWIDRHRIDDVILVSRWSVYVEGYSAADPKTDGRSDDDVLLSDGPNPSRTAEESLAAMNRQITALAERMGQRGIRLWLVRQVPVQHSSIAEAAARNMLIGAPINVIRPTSLAGHRQQQSRIEQFYKIAADAVATTGGGVLDLDPLLFDSRSIAIIRADDRYLYRDDDHLSRSGALELESTLVDLLGPANPSPISESD